MLRPSVVLDTNVVVSAHLNADGLERFLLDLAIAERIRLCVSQAILDEYESVLRRPKFGISPRLVTGSVSLIERAAKLVGPKCRVDAASDPDDNKFLECAEAAGADFLITGNKRHFPNRWKKTWVVNTREALASIIPGFQR